jgi:hypothetical protein
MSYKKPSCYELELNDSSRFKNLPLFAKEVI